MFGPMGGPPQRKEREKEPFPKHWNEVMPYIKKVWGGFFKRLLYIYKLVWETRPWILFAMLTIAVLQGVTPIIGALINKELLNSIGYAIMEKPENGFQSIVILLVVQFSYTFIVSVIGNISSLINRISSELVSNHIKLKIANKAKEVDLRSFDTPEFYERLENANREAGSRPLHILSSTLSIMSSIISMVSFIIVLGALSPIAPVIIALTAIPSAVVNFKYRKKNVMYMRWHSKERRQMSYYSDVIVNKDLVKEVKLFGLTDMLLEKYKKVFAKYFGGMKKLIYKENGLNLLISIFNVAVNCCMFVWIVRRVLDGNMEIGDYSLYTGALSAISSGILSVIGTTASIYEGTLFIDNMILFMNEKRTVIPQLAEPIHVQKHTQHEIVLENVSFRYPGMTKDVLHDINLTIRSGESIVLVGLNGAGKTTLIKLLTRLYDPTGGRILLDGRDIKDYDIAELYSLFGIIFQDFGKYAFSVRDNIRFGDIDKPENDEDIKLAAHQSNADVFIDKFENGYDTPLMRFFETDGKELSIGQWQKIAVARAFYGDSDILILDEPTASLDAIAEQEIFNQFEQLRQGKLTVFVSHRLSSAVNASQIVVLSGGTIIEKGTHKELIDLGGVYHDLFLTQAERYIATVEDESKEQKGGSDNRPMMSNLENGRPMMPPTGFEGKMPPQGFSGKRPPNFKPGERPDMPTPGFSGRPPLGNNEKE